MRGRNARPRPAVEDDGRTGRARAIRHLALLLAVTLAVQGCGGGGGDRSEAGVRAPGDSSRAATKAPDAAPATAGAAYRAGPVADAGRILGRVQFEGELPTPEEFSVSQGDREACGASVTVRRVERGGDHGLSGAVVSLRGIDRGRPFPDGPAVLDQRRCRFEPGAVVLPVGGELRVRNSDPVTHNVHTLGFENRPVNRSQPTGVDLFLRFDEPERLRVECDIHPWMGASVVVSHHPYHDVTEADGAFVLLEVPHGDYTLVAWHPELGSVERAVTVRPGEASRVSLTLPR